MVLLENPPLRRHIHFAPRATQSGGVVEWSIAPVLKTGEPKGSVGSNPTPSAIWDFRLQIEDCRLETPHSAPTGEGRDVTPCAGFLPTRSSHGDGANHFCHRIVSTASRCHSPSSRTDMETSRAGLLSSDSIHPGSTYRVSDTRVSPSSMVRSGWPLPLRS